MTQILAKYMTTLSACVLHIHGEYEDFYKHILRKECLEQYSDPWYVAARDAKKVICERYATAQESLRRKNL